MNKAKETKKNDNKTKEPELTKPEKKSGCDCVCIIF